MSKDRNFRAKGFVVWCVCSLFYLYEFFIRTVMGTYQHPLMHDLDLTTFQFSMLSTSLFLVIYGGMQVPAGLIIDKLGLKKSLMLGAAVCGLSTVGFAYTYNYPMAVTCRMLMGFGASFGFLCLLVSVNDWMPHKYNAIFIGLSQLIGTMGPMFAAGPLDALSERSGVDWHSVFIILGIIGGLLAVLVLLFVENSHENAGQYRILRKPEPVLASIKRLFVRIQPWYIALATATLYFTIEYLSENEGRAYLKLKGLSSSAASYMITISWLGYALGCPLLGMLSDFLQRRKIIMVAAAIMGIVSIALITTAFNQYALFVAFFLLGVSASGQSIGFAIVGEQFKPEFVAAGFGLNNAILTVFVALNAPLIGLLLESTHTIDTWRLEDYTPMFAVIFAVLIVAFLVTTFLVKETFCKSLVAFTYLAPRPRKK
ncbi:MAG: MFS transporter [Opitutales bacterium]